MGVPAGCAGLRGDGANSLNLIRLVPAEGFGMMSGQTARGAADAAARSHITADQLALRTAEVLEKIRVSAPRVHCLTNAVAQAFTANVLLALGAIPSMTISPEEVPFFTASAQALLVNLGTLDEARKEAANRAISIAAGEGKPWVLDPVFADRSPPRLSEARRLLALKPSLLKINAGELAALGGGASVLELSRQLGLPVAMTGAVDDISSGTQGLRLANGHPLMGKVTATGCAAGAVAAAALAVEPDPVMAAAAALSIMAIAGEMAAVTATGPGSFVPAFLDALYGLDAPQIGAHLRLA
ncbi:hydroxyethylthiazole kinase [Pannonibacter phragmitetus]|uniref:Hydroxyethylthiazole kinase n=2 Tax=Pannonibacter phragmitetus TaxID=121719 RepID=A0A0U3FPP5_9HYPH|nr:hydroxyethylthiazole kinase [Pannonibacter phragmitetus]